MKAIHFRLEELVDKDSFYSYGETCWDLLHPDALIMLDSLREFFSRPITVNDWIWGGELQYRGYRSAHCPVGALYSYHKRGRAFDCDVKGIDAATVRKTILENQDYRLLVRIMRMEDDVSWLHIDNGELPKGRNRIYLFKG